MSLCGFSAAACGYQVYKTIQETSASTNRELQQKRFREIYQLIGDREKKKAISFDLFDTLITRDVFNSDYIFDMVETISGVPNFAEVRRLAARNYCGSECSGDINEVYKHIGDSPLLASYKDRINELKTLEWNLELEHITTIRSNCDLLLKVEEGVEILVVSDTFYSPEQLRILMEKAGVPCLDRIKIYASRSGKEHGWIWPILTEYYNISSHTGDNFYSDYKKVKNNSLLPSAILSKTAHLQTPGEIVMLRRGKTPDDGETKFACMIRRLSMTNPYTFEKERERYFWYRWQMSYVAPLYWYFINSIKNILSKNTALKRIVTVSRDCILLEPLIESFIIPKFSEQGLSLCRLDCSRQLLRSQLVNPNDNYIAYMKGVMGEELEKVLVIDMNGTYRSLSDFTKKYLGGIAHAHYLSVQRGSHAMITAGFLSTAIPAVDTNVIERLNAVNIGQLVDWEDGPVRVFCEHPDREIETTRLAMMEAIKHFDDNMPMPSVKSMVALLQSASIVLTDKLREYDTPLSLQSVVIRGRTPKSIRHLEIARIISRLLSKYNDKPTSNPLRVLDTGSPSLFPWLEFSYGRIAVVTSLSPGGADVGILTCSKEPTLFEDYLNAVTDELYVIIFEDIIELQGATKKYPLSHGALYVFSKKKAQPADDN